VKKGGMCHQKIVTILIVTILIKRGVDDVGERLRNVLRNPRNPDVESKPTLHSKNNGKGSNSKGITGAGLASSDGPSISGEMPYELVHK
jgi:hypothetical protein